MGQDDKNIYQGYFRVTTGNRDVDGDDENTIVINPNKMYNPPA